MKTERQNYFFFNTFTFTQIEFIIQHISKSYVYYSIRTKKLFLFFMIRFNRDDNFDQIFRMEFMAVQRTCRIIKSSRLVCSNVMLFTFFHLLFLLEKCSSSGIQAILTCAIMAHRHVMTYSHILFGTFTHNITRRRQHLLLHHTTTTTRIYNKMKKN